VSRVLNGKAGVSDSTREAVLTALDVRGTSAPPGCAAARRLIGRLPELQNPIFPALAEVIAARWPSAGSPRCCAPDGGGAVRGRLRDLLLEQHASGVVFARRHFAELAAPHEHYELLHERGVPVVLINRRSTGWSSRAWPRRISAAGQCVRASAGPRHERIASARRRPHALAPQSWRVPHRSRASRAFGGPVEHALFSLEEGKRPPPEILRQGVTGVICGSDVLALGASARCAGPA